MNFKAHLLIGALASLLIFLIFIPVSQFMLVILTLFSAFSALLPDLDHDTSKLRQLLNRFLPVILLAFVLVSYCPSLSCDVTFETLQMLITKWLVFSGIYFITMTYLKPRHRGITHTLFAAIIYTLILFFSLGSYFALAGFLGYFSHLLADRQIKKI